MTREDRKRPVYRALVLDRDGNVLSNDVLFAFNDAEAVALARVMAQDCAIEIWEGLRFVEHIAAQGSESGEPSAAYTP